tara:strand:+ start:270 stop:533 length:264 start_codon:yes stop_codon:yes gene_type:complete
MAKYNKWEDFVNSGDEILKCKPLGFYIEKGNLNFYLDCDGKRYWCTGSECNVSDIYFDPQLTIKDQCEFNSFYMFETGNEKNQICNW